jgi:hypothetical protein
MILKRKAYLLIGEMPSIIGYCTVTDNREREEKNTVDAAIGRR